MDYNVEFKISLPEELLNSLGIDEDTPFEAYFEDGCIKVRPLDDEDFTDESEDLEEDSNDLDVPEKCVLCPNYCWNCGTCTIDI